MTTINGIPLAQARVRGELCNATDYTHASIPAWVLEDGVASWLDRARPITIDLRVLHGYGSESHLFDRTVARKAVDAVPTRESLSYAVEITEAGHCCDVPAGLESAADKIREWAAAKDAAKRRRSRAKLVRAFGVYCGADGMFRVTTAEQNTAGHWVDSISGRYWFCCGLDSRSDGEFVSLSSPDRGYGTEAEATAVLVAIQAHYTDR